MLVIIVTAGVIFGVADWTRARNLGALMEHPDNPLAWPHAWHGVACKSEINIGEPEVPFNVYIFHPPTRERAVVSDTIQKLPEHNSTPGDELWPEQWIKQYLIINTKCLDTWQEVYKSWSFRNYKKTYEMLPNNRVPTETEFRQAILKVRYPVNFETAEQMFPEVAELTLNTDK